MGIALVIGLVGTVVLTALAGARRSSSSLARFREESLAADVTVLYSDPAALERVARLPHVAGMGGIVVPFLAPLGPGDLEDYRLVTTPGGFLSEVDQVRVLEGRLPADDEVNEVAVSEALAERLDLELGAELRLRSFSVEQMASPDGFARGPQGPTIDVRVTGVVLSVFDVANEVTTDRPSGYLSPAFYRAYRDEVASFEGISRIRLRDPSVDLQQFQRDVSAIFADDPQFSLAPDSTEVARVQDSIDVIVVGLRLFAVAGAIAGLAALAQVTRLTLGRAEANGYVLGGLGMTRRERLAVGLLTVAPGLLAGSLVAVVGAALSSPLMPIDIARRAEPDAGISLDGLVLGLGGMALMLVVLGVGVVAAWRATGVREPESGWTVSAMARSLAEVGLPVTATTGARMAFHPGRGPAAVPVRSGVIGATLGVASIVAVVGFISSQAELARSPSLYGWNWDASVLAPQFDDGAELVDQVDAELVGDPALADLAVVRVSHAVIRDTYLHVLGFTDVKGSVAPTVLSGRAPTRANEVALGAASMRALGVSLDDRLEVDGTDGPIELAVVGRVVIPSLGTDAIADEGAVMTGAGADRLATTQSSFDLLFNWTPDADQRGARERLEAELGEVRTDEPPTDVANLDRVTAIPRALGVFLGGLAILAVGYELVVAVRRRRRDLAVLKVLGFRPRQIAASVAWQATLIIASGLFVGVPLGLAAGVWSWSRVTSAMGLDNRPDVPVGAVAAMIVIAVVLANVVALTPARRAARTSPAAALRVE